MTLTLVLLAMMTAIILCLLFLLTKTHSESQQMMSKTLDMMSRQNGQSQQAISQVAQSAISLMTEATTKSSADQLNWTETMVLGRQEQQQSSEQQARNVEIELDPIPGIETLDGLADNMRETLEREAQEAARWQRMSQMPQQDLDGPSPATNGHLTPKQVLSDWIEG
jgi:hypothetical protein